MIIPFNHFKNRKCLSYIYMNSPNKKAQNQQSKPHTLASDISGDTAAFLSKPGIYQTATYQSTHNKGSSVS